MYLFHSINSFKYKYNNSFVPVPIDFMAMKWFHFMQLAAVSSTVKMKPGETDLDLCQGVQNTVKQNTSVSVCDTFGKAT